MCQTHTVVVNDSVELVEDPPTLVQGDRLILGDEVFLLDWEDGPRVSEHHWVSRHGGRKVYALIGGKYVPLARFLLNAQAGQRVLRRDSNPRNFRKANMRLTGTASPRPVGCGCT